jgi:lipid-binding SYLF domain-containing protein
MLKTTTLLFLFFFLSPAIAGWDPAEKSSQSGNYRETIADFKKADLNLDLFFKKAYGYAVFPSVTKGGIGLGGAYSKGQVFEKGRAIGGVSMHQITIGLQLGGQVFSEIIFFKDRESLDKFKTKGFALAAQASAIAADEGSSSNIDYNGGVAVFTLGKSGYMVEASVGGQKFTFESKQK